MDHYATKEEDGNITLRNNILCIKKHQLSVMQGCPLIMTAMSFSRGNLGHMHTTAHHAEQMDAWHESFFLQITTFVASHTNAQWKLLHPIQISVQYHVIT